VKVERTYNRAVIEAILMDEEIYDRICGDDRAPVKVDVNEEAWILMVDEDVVGVYCLHPLNRWTLGIHAHVLPAKRDRYSVETGKAALRWVLDNSDYQKIVAEVPEVFPDVIAFTKKFGFQEEGVNRKSIKKHGKMVNQVYLGITRPEIERYFK